MPRGLPALRPAGAGDLAPLQEPGRRDDRPRPGTLGGAAGGRRLRRDLPVGRRALRSLHRRARSVVHAARPRPRRRADRLLLDRVRPARMPADLLGRPGDPLGRPLQVGLGPRDPLRRPRPDVQARLFPPDDRLRGAAATLLPRLRPAAPADPAGGRRGRPRAAGHRAAPGSRASRPGLEGRRRPRPGAAARLRPADQPPGRPADHLDPLRPRPRDAPLPGARPRHGRRAPARSARHRARRLAHERGSLGASLSRAAASRDGRGGARLRGRDRAQPLEHHLHHAHAGPGRERDVRRRPGPPLSRALVGRPRLRPGAAARARPGRRRRAVQPDGAGAAHEHPLERRERDARHRRQRQLAPLPRAVGAPADRARHERRPRAELDRPRDLRAVAAPRRRGVRRPAARRRLRRGGGVDPGPTRSGTRTRRRSAVC